MSLADQLRESRSKHTLKSYAAAVKQLHVFKAAQPMTPKKFVSSESEPVKEDVALQEISRS
ncbi:MAG: hypothetical protein ACYC67_23855 [Prosthecobacter sp.]